MNIKYSLIPYTNLAYMFFSLTHPLFALQITINPMKDQGDDFANELNCVFFPGIETFYKFW